MSTSIPHNSWRAFSLIEVTLALGIAAFCLLTVFGLLPLGLNSTQNATEQTTVSGIATAISADLHGISSLNKTLPNNTSQFGFLIPLPGKFPQIPYVQTVYFSQDGSPTGRVNTDATVGGNPSRYRATITMRPDKTLSAINPGATLYKAWILVTWPALADPKPIDNNGSGYPSNFAGSFETVTALNYYSN